MRVLYAILLVLQASLPILSAEVYEDDSITLMFQESMDETSVYTILFNEVTIFDNGFPVEGALPEEQLSRMDILESSSGNTINVNLTIQNADRTDAGTYSLRINPTTDSFMEENIDLLVIFAPSDLECAVFNDTISCNATPGYPRDGIISCYQGSEKLQGIQQDKSSVTIAARYRLSLEDTSIGCCTENSAFVFTSGNCNQFTWFTPQRVQATTTNLPPQNVTRRKPGNMTRVPTTTNVPLETDILYQKGWLTQNRAVIGFMCGILFVLVVMYPFGMTYHFRVYMKEPKKYVSDSKGRGHFTSVSSV
ncbi:uncharacterized protein LOC135153854 [Lytechinus pictus]|uniref:uncharacterized protein LOC135153854 n=1 Tax=Lytechinus pictus TaxID=7653 RepID=UPI0030B9E0AF